MTVEELIKELEKYPRDMRVFLGEVDQEIHFHQYGDDDDKGSFLILADYELAEENE